MSEPRRPAEADSNLHPSPRNSGGRDRYAVLQPSAERQSRSRSAARRSTFETGKLAKQADGAVVVRSGRHDGAGDGAGPARRRARARTSSRSTVDVEERMYAAGKIPGGFFKREGRADRARDPDRAHDRPPDPAALAEGLQERGAGDLHRAVAPTWSRRTTSSCINGASAALMVSPLPFLGPVGAVRVGRIDGELVVNPTLPELEEHAARPDRRRHEGRPDDGRGRRRRGPGGDDPRGARPRAQRDPADLRGAGGSARAGRQAEVARSGADRGARGRARSRDLAADPGPGHPRGAAPIVEELLERARTELSMDSTEDDIVRQMQVRAGLNAAAREAAARSPSRRRCASSSRTTSRR